MHPIPVAKEISGLGKKQSWTVMLLMQWVVLQPLPDLRNVMFRKNVPFDLES